MSRLILCTVIFLTGVQIHAQRVHLSLKHASFKELFKAVEAQTGFSFVYTTEQLRQLPPVTINSNDIDLISFLDRKLQDSPVGFTVKDSFIILVSKSITPLKGKVIDQLRRPIEGITIQKMNGETIAVTDEQGYFNTGELLQNTRLMISGAEIETSFIKLTGNNYIEIMVTELIRELEETVIPGYGSIKKRFNTGNIVKINVAELPPSSTGNLLTSMQARVPGLLITATGGAPSSSYLMQIRGQHSINPNPLINYRIPPVDQPLIIIDGVPFAPQNNNVNQLTSLAAPGNLEFYQNPYGGISPFSLINPEMVESVEILKDAVSTSIYGSRAANGILLITTRKPKTKDFLVETHVSTGINLIAGRPSMLAIKDYLDLRKTAFSSDSLQPNLIPGSPAYAPDLLKYDSNRQTDWSKYFFHTATPFSSISTTVQGQAGKFGVLSGLTLRHEKYLLKGDFFSQQFSSNNQLRFTSANKRLNIETGIVYSRSWNHSLASPSLLEAIRLPPNYPEVYDQLGNINWNDDGVDLSDNPAALLRQTYSIDASDLLISPKVSYRFSKEITGILSAGYSGFTTKEMSIFPMSSFSIRNQPNAQSLFAKSHLSSKLFEPQIEYKIKPGEFRLTILAGLTLQQNKTQLGSKRGTRYSSEAMMTSIENAGKVDERFIGDSYHYASLFSSIHLQYASKYLLHLSGRNERSSRFSSDSKAGRFSSLGLGWIFSEEQFKKNRLRWLHFGKLRVSYGSSGDDNVGYYHYLYSWTQTQDYSAGPDALPLRDASLSWSVTKKLEVGLDLRMFDNGLTLEISAYRHQSANQLISQVSPAQTGRSRYLLNFPAVVENSGLEITAGFPLIKNTKPFWLCEFNISLPTNKLRKFPSIESSLYSSLYWLNNPLNAIESIHYSGIDSSTGFYSFEQSQKSYINTTPKIYGSWTNKIMLKRWTLEMIVEFRIQTGINYLKQITDYHAGEQFNLPIGFSEGNNPAGVSLQRPALPFNLDAMLATFLLSDSDAAYSNASYLKLRSFRINYDLQKGTLKNTKLYLQLQNILTMTSFKLTDPEVQSFYSYPLSKCFSAGISLRL